MFVYDPIDYMWVAYPSWLWHLQKIQADLAWDITRGDPNVNIAIIDYDFDVTHPDLASEIFPHYDPYTMYQYTCNTTHWHGTTVASFASAETTEQGGSSQGQLASVGFNTKIIGYMSSSSRQVNLAKALHASNVMGADVIVSCAGATLGCYPDPNSGEELIVQEILDNGTVIVMAAGNGLSGAHCGASPNNYHPFYPFNPIYDERIIIVTSTDENDYHQFFSGTTEVTHSHFSEVDICAPGYDVMGAKPTECGGNPWPYFGGFGGTSFSSPIVAGVCALLKSVNPDFTPGEIQHFIKSTADPVTDANNYPGMLGAGRINAFKAVEMANNCAPIIITSDETWNDDREIACGLIIQTDVTLTIHSVVKLSKRSDIIIETGGTLILDGGILSSLDNIHWPGIQVWGDSDESQQPLPGQPCAQGKLTLRNDAVIENAEVAVSLWRPGYYETTGGIVDARSGSVFRNNALSILVLDYRNIHPTNPLVELDNFSTFENCTFEITNDYMDDVTFFEHVMLFHVKGIDFHNCDFTVNSNIPGVSEYNHAIYAFDAGFSVQAICNSIFTPCPDENWDKCTFTGFYNAILAQSDGSTSNTLLVNRAVFNDNIYGVKIEVVNNAAVLFSEFNIGENTVDVCPDAAGVGIFLEEATGFAFENNNFTKFQGAPPGNYIGISINSTNASDEVYNNDFDNLSYANYSEGKNWGFKTFEGLTYFCNQNTNNYADFYVGVNDGGIGGIQSSQGDDDHVTGNKFSSQSGATWHFYNGGNHQVGYYYCDYCTDENPDDNLIYHVTDNGKNFNNTCQSHYDDDPPGDLVLPPAEQIPTEQDYFNNLTSYNNVKTLYDNLIDGGSTSAEVIDIQTALPQDMWALRAQLLGDSPHLSMEVLKEAADKTEVFTEAALFDILTANPDELKKEELLKYLEEKQDPLPAYMIDILRSVATGTTYETVLQQQMARYNRSKTRAAHDIIRSILNDSVTDNNELRNWLDNLDGLSSDRQIIATYIQDSNFSSAYTLANMLPQLYMFDNNELIEHNFYMEVLSLHDTLYSQGRNINQLDSTEISALVFIADSSSGLAGTQARSILEASYDHHYVNCPCLDGIVGHKNSNININMDALNKISGINISVKPNPAKQWAAFDYTLPENATNAKITIRDVTGKVIEVLHVTGQQGQKLWDTRQIKQGVYIYTLEAVGYSMSGKLIINE